MKTFDISGMGGSYENACQIMLQAGIKALAEEGIKGSTHSNEEIAELLAKVMSESVEHYGGATGAMMSTCGYWVWIFYDYMTKWNKSFDETVKDLLMHELARDIFDWDGSESTCPPINSTILKGWDMLGIRH
jgi:hypothetical protein